MQNLKVSLQWKRAEGVSSVETQPKVWSSLKCPVSRIGSRWVCTGSRRLHLKAEVYVPEARR